MMCTLSAKKELYKMLLPFSTLLTPSGDLSTGRSCTKSTTSSWWGPARQGPSWQTDFLKILGGEFYW